MLLSSLNIISPILKALEEEGYQSPTPIQEQAIPVALAGTDVLACAQTGTGKTAAFSIPILQLLNAQSNNRHKKVIKALILTPTRELAIQIEESLQAYGKYTEVKSAVIFGGVNQFSQTQVLDKGVDILVATPGRLLDLINQKIISLKNIEFFVLDEADRMLDMGFIHDVKKIIALLPKQRQTLFFSATMPPEIVKLSSLILHKPKTIEVTPASTTAETINQFVYLVNKKNKKNLLVHLLKNEAIENVLVFTRTKFGANQVAKYLNDKGITAMAIHGNKSQSARQIALQTFKSKETRVLVATDIAARGIDVNDLGFVINYEIPNIPETYVHRIGRTGRAGAKGIAISFCEPDEKPLLQDIQKLISIKIPIVEDNPFPFSQELENETLNSDKRANNLRMNRNSKKNIQSKKFHNKPKM